MPTAEVKGVWWACITWPRKSVKLSWSSLLLGANANKATTPDPSDCLCSVSLPISVFFTHSLHDVLREGQGTVSKRRGLIACVFNTYGKLLSPNHLWSLPAAPHSDLSARQYKGVIPGYDVRPSASQHVIRGCYRSFSATASLRHINTNMHLLSSFKQVSLISKMYHKIFKILLWDLINIRWKFKLYCQYK